MGLATQNLMRTDQQFDHVALTEHFREMVFSDGAPMNKAEFDAHDIDLSGHIADVATISILNIEQAEWNLGHNMTEPEDIEQAAQKFTDNVLEFKNHKIFDYSVDDVEQEKNGPSDGNLATAGGHLKQGILNPNIHDDNVQNKHKKNRQYVNMADDHAAYMADLQATIDRLTEEIDALREEAREAQEVIDDLDAINDETPEGEDVRARASKTLKSKGKSLDDYKKADGTYNEERLREDLALIRAEAAAEAARKAAERQEIEQELDNNFNNNRQQTAPIVTALKEAQASGDEEKVAEIQAMVVKDDYDAPGNLGKIEALYDNVSIDEFEKMAPSGNTAPPTPFSLDDMLNFGNSSSTIASLEEPTERQDITEQSLETTVVEFKSPDNKEAQPAVGSFAASDEERNHISDGFRMAADPDAAAEALAQEATAKPDADMTFEPRENIRSYGMA